MTRSIESICVYVCAGIFLGKRITRALVVGTFTSRDRWIHRLKSKSPSNSNNHKKKKFIKNTQATIQIAGKFRWHFRVDWKTHLMHFNAIQYRAATEWEFNVLCPLKCHAFVRVWVMCLVMPDQWINDRNFQSTFPRYGRDKIVCAHVSHPEPEWVTAIAYVCLFKRTTAHWMNTIANSIVRKRFLSDQFISNVFVLQHSPHIIIIIMSMSMRIATAAMAATEQHCVSFTSNQLVRWIFLHSHSNKRNSRTKQNRIIHVALYDWWRGR